MSEHSIQLSPLLVSRLRRWLDNPNGSHRAGERVGFEAVVGGGVLVRTAPYGDRELSEPDAPDVWREYIQPGLWVVLDASQCIVLEVRTADGAVLLARVALSDCDQVTLAMESARVARADAEDTDDRRRAGSIAAALAGGPKDSTDDYPASCYEVHAGIRPPRKSGKVRAIVFEKVPGGGLDIYACDHDHAPGVHRCQDISPDQMAEVIRCGRDWAEDQIASQRLSVLPIVWERP